MKTWLQPGSNQNGMSEDCCLKILPKQFFFVAIVLSLTYSNKFTWLAYDVTMTSSWIKNCDFTTILIYTSEIGKKTIYFT